MAYEPLDIRQSVLREAALGFGTAANTSVDQVLLAINTIFDSGATGQILVSTGSAVPTFSSVASHTFAFTGPSILGTPTLAVGTTGTVFSNFEGMSVYYASNVDPGASSVGLAVLSLNTYSGNLADNFRAVRALAERTPGTSSSDSSIISALRGEITINNGSNPYSNSGSLNGLEIPSISAGFGAGAVTATTFGINIANDTGALTGTKYGIFVGNISGGSVNNYGIYCTSSLTVGELAGSGTRPLSVDSSGTLVSGAATYSAPTVQKFTSGTGTYTTPSNVLYIKVTMVGAGGGGGGSGGSGGTSAGNGGNSTFGTTLLVANGGTAGAQGASSGNGGAGGTASLGSGPIGTALSGGSGSPCAANYQDSSGGSGAGSALGGAGGGGSQNGGAGNAGATNTGGGGGGGGINGATANGGGGGGAGGYVYAIITSPSATYSYAVGAAGTAGTAGSSGANGGAGGSGYIMVEEYYQ